MFLFCLLSLYVGSCGFKKNKNKNKNKNNNKLKKKNKAEQAIVLLKNENNILPLSQSKKLKIAMIGPHANATQDMLSNYHGTNTLVNSHSPLQAFSKRNNVDILYSMGCDINCQTDDAFYDAIQTAIQADYAFVFLGLTPSFVFFYFILFYFILFYFIIFFFMCASIF